MKKCLIFGKTLIKRKRIYTLQQSQLIVYVSPLFILGENAHIRVHDNLDSNIAWYKVLKNSGQLFGGINSTLPQIINGLPRNTFGTEFSGIQWLYGLFPTMLAYSLSQTITRVFALIGMYLLLKKHFIKSEDAYAIRVLVSLAFALTPFLAFGHAEYIRTAAGAVGFLTIRNREGTWKEWLTLLLLPFYASFVSRIFLLFNGDGVAVAKRCSKKTIVEYSFFKQYCSDDRCLSAH